MKLSEFALLVDAPRKWVLNTRALLRFGSRYTLAMAERLALTRVLNNDLAISLPRAWEIAGAALTADRDSVEIAAGDGEVTVVIDLQRLRAAIAVRRAQLVTSALEKRAGRRPKPHPNPLIAATDYGLDVTLLHSNLARRPDERIRQLDAMIAFRSRVQRRT